MFGADGRSLWVTAEQASQIVKLSIPDGKVLATRRTSGAPHDIALDGRGRLWVTVDGSSRVDVRSVRTGALIARPDLRGAPHDVVVAPGDGSVWFSNWRSGILTVAPDDSYRRIGSVAAGSEPHHFAFGLGLLWVSDNVAGTLIRINPRSERVLGRTAVGPAPHHPVVAGPDVFVAVHGGGLVVVLGRDGRVLASIPVGPGPHGLAAVAVPTR